MSSGEKKSAFQKYRDRMFSNGADMGESLINNTLAYIDKTFKEAPTYRNLTVRKYGFPNKKQDARVLEISRLGSLRYVLLPPHQTLEIGNYLEFDGETWLTFDKHGGSESLAIKMTVALCNRKLRWIDPEYGVIEMDCVASATDLGSKARQSRNELEWNKYDVTLPLGQLFVNLEANELTRKIKISHRFILGSKVYEVIGYDDITGTSQTNDEYGYIQLIVRVDVTRKADNFDTGIAQQNEDIKQVINPETEESNSSDGEIEIEVEEEKKKEDENKGGSIW